MIHAWQDPNGYPGSGMHECGKKLANRKPGDPHPAVPPQRRSQAGRFSRISSNPAAHNSPAVPEFLHKLTSDLETDIFVI
jgi:hypothetical protein